MVWLLCWFEVCWFFGNMVRTKASTELRMLLDKESLHDMPFPMSTVKPRGSIKMARLSKQAPVVQRAMGKLDPSRKQNKPAPLPESVSLWTEFYRVVRRIPCGRVCTYGAVAAMASHPRSARHVGYALAALKESGKNADVPWQRVLGSKGKKYAGITIKDPVGAAVQRMLLEAEGVEFDASGRVSIERFGWFLKRPSTGA